MNKKHLDIVASISFILWVSYLMFLRQQIIIRDMAVLSPVVRFLPCESEIPIGRILGRWQGVASYYSEAGCLGCSPNLTMANGETFKDYGFTVAFNKLPLDTWVTVRNMETDDITYARITDRHGADNEKYGFRLIDLSLAVKNAISCTDLCNVEVKEVNFD